MKEIVIKTKKQKKGLEIVILCLVEVNYLYLRTWSQKLAIVFKKLYAKFCAAFFSYHELMTLQSIEYGVSDVILVNVQNNSSLVFIAYFC